MAAPLSCEKCNEGWICEEHPDKRMDHDGCAGPGMPCENAACDYSIKRTG
jgi:hypothetical protein